MKFTRPYWTIFFAIVIATNVGAAQQLQSMSLRGCVQYALEHNPRIVSARERVDVVTSRVGQAASATRPQVDVEAGYTDSDPAPRDTRKYRMLVSGRKLLYDSGETDALTARARSQRAGTIADLRTVRLDVARETAGDYFGLLRARRLVEVAKEVRRQAREHHSLARARYDAGTVARADVLRARVELARAEQEVVSAEKSEDLAKTRLLNTLGASQSEDLQITKTEADRSPPPERAAAMEYALAHRSELVAMDEKIDAAEAMIRAARTSTQPEVSIQADWGTRDNDFPPTESAWSIGLGASMSLSDGGLTRERVKEAKAELRELEAERRRQAQLIQMQVAEVLLDYHEARQRTDLAEEEVTLAHHSMEVASGRYRVGEGLLIEVIDARTALRKALAAQAEARYDVLTARAEIARAMGTLPTEEAQR